MRAGCVIAGEDQKSSCAVAAQGERLRLDELPRDQLQAPHRELLPVVAAVLLTIGEPLAGRQSGQFLEQLRILHRDEVHGDRRVVVGARGDIQGQPLQLDPRREEIRAAGQRQDRQRQGEFPTYGETSVLHGSPTKILFCKSIDLF